MELVKLYADIRDKHKPKYLPLHSKEGVTAGLQKDRHWRRPRRMVDWSTLSKLCNREMFRALSPFKVTKQIPTEVWRSATDAWEGFHPR